MSYEGWVSTGTPYGIHDGAVYLRKANTLDTFVWGGRCMRVMESTEALGDVTVTTRFNPRGGLERDQMRIGAPGETTYSVEMKRLQADRKRVDLKTCIWDVDQRTHCGGADVDSMYQWEEIKRHCSTHFTNRRDAGIDFEGENTEAIVAFDATALWTDDIFRVFGDRGRPYHFLHATDVQLLDVATCAPRRCPDVCDEQELCVVAAISEYDGAAASYLCINLQAGDLDAWAAPVALTGFGTNHPTQITCMGDFLVVTSLVAKGLIYSDDLGTTQVFVAPTIMQTYAPRGIDAIDQTFIVVVGQSGRVYASYDAARTWTTLSAGDATTYHLWRVMIARDNPQVIYAISDAFDSYIKTENGGETWASGVTGAGGAPNLASLWVINQNHVLIGTDEGHLYQTLDGGTTWTQQTLLPDITAAQKVNTKIADIVGCGCGVLWLVTENSSDSKRNVYRNVDGGADGRWYKPEQDTITFVMTAITCCDSSRAIAVGGTPTTSDAVVLFA